MLKRAMATAVGAVLALSIGAAGAYFTAQVQVPDNYIKGGKVSVSTEPTSSALSVSALAPGTTIARPLSVINDGNLAADVTVTASKKAGFTDFYEALTCRVSSGSVELYEGPLSKLRTSPVRLPPGARGDMKFEIALPASAGNDLSTDYVSLSLYVDAEQAH